MTQMDDKIVILVADDSDFIIKLYKKALSDNYDLLVAKDGRDALKLLENNNPAICLLDVSMPHIGGLEVCQEIRKRSSFKFTKIIFVSANISLDDRIAGYQVGADDYICKPFDEDELLAKIRVFKKLYILENKLLRLNQDLIAEVKEKTMQNLSNASLASVGLYTSEIIHNIRSPLQVISAATTKLKLHHLTENNEKFIDMIYKANENLQQISETILDKVRTAHANNSFKTSEKVFLDEILEKELAFHLLSFKKNKIKVIKDLKHVHSIHGLSIHFSQIFENLIKNAIQAIQTMQGDDERKILVRCYEEDGRVVVSIADSGPGIPKELQEKIFQPFFTTKTEITDSIEKGTGLGLSSCKRMIESYNGELLVSSEIGSGSEFTIKI